MPFAIGAFFCNIKLNHHGWSVCGLMRNILAVVTGHFVQSGQHFVLVTLVRLAFSGLTGVVLRTVSALGLALQILHSLSSIPLEDTIRSSLSVSSLASSTHFLSNSNCMVLIWVRVFASARLILELLIL